MALAEEAGAQIVDLRFCDLPGLMQHFSVPIGELSDERVRPRVRLRRLVDPGLPGDPGVRHAADARPERRVHRPLPRRADARAQLLREGPGDRRVVLAATRGTSRGRPSAPATDRASPTRRSGDRSASSTSSIRSGSTRTPHEGYYQIDSVAGIWNSGAEEGGHNLGYKPRHKEGYFPLPPMDHYQDLRTRDGPQPRRRSASRSRSTTTRSARPARPRSTSGTARCWRPPTT